MRSSARTGDASRGGDSRGGTVTDVMAVMPGRSPLAPAVEGRQSATFTGPVMALSRY